MKNKLSAILMVVLAACGAEEAAVEAIAPGAPGTAPTPAEPVADPVPPMPTVELTPEQTTRAAEVAALATERGSFPREVTSDKTLAPVLLYLAATSDQENVLIAAMSSFSGAWTITPSAVERGYTLIDDTFIGVINHRIHDERPRVQDAAIEGGGVAFRRSDTNEALLDTFLAMANAPGASPQLRYAIMQRIWQSQMAFTQERIQFFVNQLDAPEPWLVSTALFRLNGNMPNEPWAAPIRAKLLELTRHADPGVRGRAADALAAAVNRLPETDAERVTATARFVEMMGDENPYTKSCGINAQRTIGNISAIPAIVTHLDDATPNTYDIRGWTDLAGNSGTTHHDGSAWSQVRDSALYTIKSMSYSIDRENRFDYTITGGSSADDLTAAAAACRTWVAAHADSIPQ